MDRAAEIAGHLLRIGAVKLSPDDPFTWASGLRSPIYTDNRVALAHPRVRGAIRDGLTELARTLGPLDAVVGVATAGIPHGVLVAEALKLPFAYVRAKAKAHGRQNRIEGELHAGQRVAVVEDLVSTGGSSLEAVAAVREAGVEVAATLAIFTYGFDAAAERFAQADCPLHTLSDYPALVAEARRTGLVSEAQLDGLTAWRAEASRALANP